MNLETVKKRKVSLKTSYDEVIEERTDEDKKNKNRFQQPQQKNCTQNDQIKSANDKIANVNSAPTKLPDIKKNASLPSWRYDNCDVYLNLTQEMDQLVVGEELKSLYRENFPTNCETDRRLWARMEAPEPTAINILQRNSHLKYLDVKPHMYLQVFEKCSSELQPRWVNKLWQTKRKPASGIVPWKNRIVKTQPLEESMYKAFYWDKSMICRGFYYKDGPLFPLTYIPNPIHEKHLQTSKGFRFR